MQQILLNRLFGYWKVIKKSDHSKSYYDCLCTGCKSTIKSIRKWNLLDKRTTSCGCKRVATMEKTNLQKYKCRFTQQNQEIKNKSIKTLIEKYQVENYSQTKEFVEKCRETSIRRWGKQHHTKSSRWQLSQKPLYGMIVLGTVIDNKKTN